MKEEEEGQLNFMVCTQLRTLLYLVAGIQLLLLWLNVLGILLPLSICRDVE
jgi:hypothetical protein